MRFYVGCHQPSDAHRFESADSMAWSYAARKQGRNGNDWREGEAFRLAIDAHQPEPWQPPLMVV